MLLNVTLHCYSSVNVMLLKGLNIFVQNVLRDLNRMRKQGAHHVLPDFIRAKPETETAPNVRGTQIQAGKPEAPNVVSGSSIIYVNDLIYISVGKLFDHSLICKELEDARNCMIFYFVSIRTFPSYENL